MWRGIFALFFRSLRCDSRSLWVHVSWLFLLIVIYVTMLIVAQTQTIFRGAPGLLFFQYVIYTNAVFVTLLGVSYFSSVISEEKEEDTLGLMTMAGISPLGILLGKSTTRLFQVFLLLAIQYPFTLLAITLGGLKPDQIYAAYAALLVYTLLLANAGLFCSVLSRRNRDAAGLTTLWLIAYIFTPLFALAGFYYLTTGPGAGDPTWIMLSPTLVPILTWLSKTSVFGELYEVTQTEYQFVLTPQLISNSIGGVLLFASSWLLFGLVSHEPATEATSRSFVPRRTGRLRWFSAGRVHGSALMWKDFHFMTGGWFGIAMRCGLYVGLYWLAFVASYPWYEPASQRQIHWYDVTWGFQFFVVPLFCVDCALVMSRLFQEEIRHQTLASLLMLPRSVPYLVYQKLAGCLLGLIPGMLAVFTAFFLLTEIRSSLAEIIDEPPAYWVIGNLLLVIHLSGLLSLYLRWGAFAMALAITVGSMIATMVVLQSMMFTMGPSPLWMETALGLLAVPIFLLCASCHVIAILKLPALGEK